MNESLKGGVAVSGAECKCCKTTLKRWKADNHSAYQVNIDNATTSNHDPWWLARVLCYAKQGATQSHCLSTAFGIMLSNSGDVVWMWQAGSSYGLLHWAHRVVEAEATKKWYCGSLNGDGSGEALLVNCQTHSGRLEVSLNRRECCTKHYMTTCLGWDVSNRGNSSDSCYGDSWEATSTFNASLAQ